MIAVGTAAPIGPGGVWLDENGLLLYEPDPGKVWSAVGQLAGCLQAASMYRGTCS